MVLRKTATQTPVLHGGDLWRAMQQYGGAPSEWLDLSTGINPHAYPVPPLPDDIWRCLPNDHDGLNEIAAQYYGLCEHQPLLAVPGSQYAIRHLPALLPPGAVGIADLTYSEYAPAFQRAGHPVLRYRYPDLDAPPMDTADAAITTCTASMAGTAGTASTAGTANTASHMRTFASALSEDGTDIPLFTLHPDRVLPEALRYLVVVNPNNPSTHHYSVSSLLKWRDTLHARGGMLIVDEAFADVDPSHSVLHAFTGRSNADGMRSHVGSGGENGNDGNDERDGNVGNIERDFAGVLVLRSVGKFFGLAGIRAGFVMGPASVLHDLSQQMGAWAVSGPARHAMRHALPDLAWQTAMRARLKDQSASMMAILAGHRLHGRATPLFVWLPHPQAAALQQGMAQYRIWTRLFGPCASSGGHASLRIGIPADTADLDRLDQAFAKLKSTLQA